MRCGEFLIREMVREGRVLRSWKDGRARIPGFLEDHAGVALGCLALYELTFDPRWLTQARALGDAVIASFWDTSTNAFFDTAHDHEQLITRPRDVTDNATPSGTSLAVELLLRLAELYRDAELSRPAMWTLETLAAPLAQHGIAFGHLLGAADLAIHGATEVAIAGDPCVRRIPGAGRGGVAALSARARHGRRPARRGRGRRAAGGPRDAGRSGGGVRVPAISLRGADLRSGEAGIFAGRSGANGKDGRCQNTEFRIQITL